MNGAVVLCAKLAERLLALVLLSLILFALLAAMPGPPGDLSGAADPTRSPAELSRLEAADGRGRPLLERYGCWLLGRREPSCAWWPGGGLLNGDLGYSRIHKVPVAEIVGDRLANTLRLMIPALLIALAAAAVLGTLAAVRAGSLLDRALNALALLELAVPTHWLAMVAILIFAGALGWLPPSGVDDPRVPGLGGLVRHAVLPVLVLAATFAGRWFRFMRAAVLEVLGLEHLRTARAKGLPERTVILNHAVRNALIPLVGVVAETLPALFSGALITETVFSYPGMGVLLAESVEAHDLLVALSILLVFAALTMLATALQDAFYRALDPRLRREP
jgi:peptide/nickel transport system permease protein